MQPGAVQSPIDFIWGDWPGEKFDLVRSRVQQETLGHRGRKHDPLYDARKLLVLAKELVLSPPIPSAQNRE